MIASIFITLIAFVAAMYVMNQQITETKTKLTTDLSDVDSKVNTNLNSLRTIAQIAVNNRDVSGNTSNLLTQHLDQLGSMSSNILADVRSQYDPRINATATKTEFNTLTSNIQSNIDRISGDVNVRMGNVESSVDDLSSNLLRVESTYMPIVGEFSQIQSGFSNVNSNMSRLQQDIDILKTREDSGLPADFYDTVRGEIGNYMSNNPDQIRNIVGDSLAGNIQGIVDDHLATIDITTPDLTNVNVGLSNVNVGLSNVNVGLVNLYSEMSNIQSNLDTIQSTGLDSTAVDDTRSALNQFFKPTNTVADFDCVSKYKDTSSINFRSWFADEYLNGSQFESFPDMINKSGRMYNQMGDMNTELTSIKGILDGIGAADGSVNLGEITSIFQSNQEMIQEINDNLQNTVDTTIQGLDSSYFINKFDGASLTSMSNVGAESVNAQTVSANNMEVTGNLTIDGSNIKATIEDIYARINSNVSDINALQTSTPSPAPSPSPSPSPDPAPAPPTTGDDTGSGSGSTGTAVTKMDLFNVINSDDAGYGSGPNSVDNPYGFRIQHLYTGNPGAFIDCSQTPNNKMCKTVHDRLTDVETSAGTIQQNYLDKTNDRYVANVTNSGSTYTFADQDGNAVNSLTVPTFDKLTDIDMASDLGISSTDFSFVNVNTGSGTPLEMSMPTKYIHSAATDPATGDITLKQVDLINGSKSDTTISAPQNLSGTEIVNKIDQEDASFMNGLRIGDGCLKVYRGTGQDTARLNLCNSNCETASCVPIWDHHFAPAPIVTSSSTGSS